MPAWVSAGYEEYAGRLPRECALVLKEIAPEKRSKGFDPVRIKRKEADKLLAAIPRDSRVIALDVNGKGWSTEALARQLEGWMMGGRDVALLVGGPEGLTDECRQRAEAVWSLSPLTFPHPLVRIVVAEQIYRAWSLNAGHPYHRA